MPDPETSVDPPGYIKRYLMNYVRNPSEDFSEGDGLILQGCFSLYDVTKEKIYLDVLSRSVSSFLSLRKLSHPEASESLGRFTAGGILFESCRRKPTPEKLDALSKLRDDLLSFPRLKNGCFAHDRRNPAESRLSDSYRALPFYYLMTRTTRLVPVPRSARTDLINQLEEARSFHQDPESGQYKEAYDENGAAPWANRSNGRSPYVFLPDVGYYAAACADLAELFQKSYRPKLEQRSARILADVLFSMGRAPTKEGLYLGLPFLYDERNVGESVGNLLLAYAKMKGARNRDVTSLQNREGRKLFEAVLRENFADGHLGNIAPGSGIDLGAGSLEDYFSAPPAIDSKEGIGALMLAYSEYLRPLR